MNPARLGALDPVVSSILISNLQCPREIRYLRNAPTVLETLNAHTIHIPGREALARDMVTRIRPLIDGLTSTVITLPYS